MCQMPGCCEWLWSVLIVSNFKVLSFLLWTSSAVSKTSRKSCRAFTALCCACRGFACRMEHWIHALFSGRRALMSPLKVSCCLACVYAEKLPQSLASFLFAVQKQGRFTTMSHMPAFRFSSTAVCWEVLAESYWWDILGEKGGEGNQRGDRNRENIDNKTQEEGFVSIFASTFKKSGEC